MILSVCDVPEVIKVLKIVRMVIVIIIIAVPIILIVSSMLDYTHAVNNPDELGDTHKRIIRKVVAALLVFLVPTFISIVVKLVDPTANTYVGCLNNATSENITAMYKNGMKERMDAAEKSADIASYNEAKNYLNNIEDEELKEKYKKKLDKLKETIDAKNPVNPNTTPKSGGIVSGDKHNVSDDDIKWITKVCVCEQGSNIDGIKAEASLIVNRYELYGDSSSSIKTYVIKSKWFACAGAERSITNDQISAVKDVIVNGNRVFPPYVDEHDCINCNSSNKCSNGSLGDICSITNNGRSITNMSDLKNRSRYVSGKTVIHNVYGGDYTFYSFPCSSCDPFGYTSQGYNIYKKR